eukprot:2350727-Lingulodinium_polyedra.AAC.1
MADLGKAVVEAVAQGHGPLLDRLHSFSSNVFSGWGQTKIIEDGLQQLRDGETRATTNKRLQAAR